MKKKIYFITITVFILVTGFVIFRYQGEQNSFYPLLKRSGPSASSKEWGITKQYAENLSNVLDKNPNDGKALLAMTSLYLQEERVTGNYLYYDKAALRNVNRVLTLDTLNFEALTFKSMIYLSQHHFAEGRMIAEKAKNINPYNAFIYGLLIDGNVEMGEYDSAIANADRMMGIRPDLRSYSRVSYLREIYGDYPGAIQAMKLAVDAGAPGDESTCWSRVQLGKLYEYTGDLKSAEMHYTIALDERPGYAFAYAGLGRIAKASGNIPAAIRNFQTADNLVKDNAFKEELVIIYKETGNRKRADSLNAIVINNLTGDAEKGNKDENIGHYADRELALAYLNAGDYDKALEHALLEYNRRPANIDVNETLAWVYYKKGEFQKAATYIRVAMKTKSVNPLLLCYAGLIYKAAGDYALAKSCLENAFKTGTTLPGEIQVAGKQALQTL